MKVFLRDWEKGLLFRAPGNWVQNWVEATDFADPDRAADQARGVEQGKLEIFVVHDDGKPLWGKRLEAR